MPPIPRNGSSWLVNPKSATEVKSSNPDADTAPPAAEAEPSAQPKDIIWSSSFIECEVEEEEEAGEAARDDVAEVDGRIRTRILPFSEGVVSKEISRSPRARRASASISANSSRLGRVNEGLGVGICEGSEEADVQSKSLGRNGLKSKDDAEEESAVGRENVEGTFVDWAGIDSRLGSAQRRTCEEEVEVSVTVIAN